MSKDDSLQENGQNPSQKPPQVPDGFFDNLIPAMIPHLLEGAVYQGTIEFDPVESVAKTFGRESVSAPPLTRQEREAAKEEGRLEGVRASVLAVSYERFPDLNGLAHQKVFSLRQPDALYTLLRQIVKAPDEESIRKLLLA